MKRARSAFFPVLSSRGEIAVLPLAFIMAKPQRNSHVLAPDGDVEFRLCLVGALVTGEFRAVARY